MLKGARWNSPGKRVIYAAQTYAGAVLEILVHANLASVPRTLASVTIDIPDDVAIDVLSSTALRGWDAEDLLASRLFGDRWLDERRTAVLLVPSAVLQGRENNVLLNPEHPAFARIQASAPEPVAWDPRLFSRSP